ncbi:SURF1 family protein [Streptomyces sp. BI20]|uniref:SURF1 family cytochrome oxidase biogenesis protein n=1 Tax=Streptomyces sp. BI20 TaxID=3403460 RepID=UPI003C764310
MYRFLLTRQWVILALIGLVLIPAMIELGFWQFHRHERRVAQNAMIAANLTAKPVPMSELSAPGGEVRSDQRWRAVTATGRYDPANEVVVRTRTSNDDEVGFMVVTPLVQDDGRVVLVNRGWIPRGDDLTAYPPVPPAPAGEVTVTGRLKADETDSSGIKEKKGLPERQVMRINSEQQAARIGKPVLAGYLEQTAPLPANGTPELVSDPDHESIGPHMAYAVQWWLFAAMVPVGWVVLVRREVRDRARAAARAAATAGDGPDGDEPAAADPEGSDAAGRPLGSGSPTA